MASHSTDERFMRLAMILAARALGRVAPNPAVGCIIVSSDGRIVGRGITQDGGRPHAETMALSHAGAAAQEATAYVSLQPCTHQGQTPPCLDALVAAGIARIVYACPDIDPRIADPKSLGARLKGTVLEEGPCRREAEQLNEGFFRRVKNLRPLVALKIAESADGRIDDARGKGRRITGDEARTHTHLLRATFDGILIGIGTALADDPELTCRLPGLEARSPQRIVLDPELKLPHDARLARTARAVPLTVITGASSGGERLSAAGAEIIRLPLDSHGTFDLVLILRLLADRGMTRLLVEGGRNVHASFLDRGLADRLYVYRSPEVLEAGPLSAIGEWRKTHSNRLVTLEKRPLGADVLESFAVEG